MTRLLCMGDSQIGVPTVDLADQELVLDRIADLAVSEQVAAVLHGGDIFHGPTVMPEHLRVFAGFVERLREQRIPVLAISGNGSHDMAMRETNALAIFNRIPGITVASRPDVYRIGDCAVGALPWVHPGRLVAAADGGDRDRIHEEAARRLVRVAEGLREDCAMTAHRPSVLLLHWSVSGATLPSGVPVEEAREPILELADLAGLGFDAVVCAHVHRPQLLSAPAAAPVFYVGSPQPLNHGEAGDAHGVWIVELGGPVGTLLRFCPVESRRFVTLDLDLTETLLAEEFDVAGTFAAWLVERDLAGAVVRARYRVSEAQARRIDAGGVRRGLLDAGAWSVRVEAEIVRVSRARVEAVDDQLGETAALELWLGTQDVAEDVAAGMRARHAEYMETLA